MAQYIDQIGHRIELLQSPRRIVSTVPSQTELLFDLGLDERIVGVTKFCIHPLTHCRSKAQIGGTKNLKLPVIASLHPDLIIANKEENSKEDIRYLQAHFPVWTSDITTVSEALAMIAAVGAMTGTTESAHRLLAQVKNQHEAPLSVSPQKAIYLIWNDPIMVAGPETFIHHMMIAAGFINTAPKVDNQRYPILTPEEINQLQVDLLLLSTEPYPFKESDVAKFQSLFPRKKIVLVDGEMFSWYGSRMTRAFAYFKQYQNTDNQYTK